ncbi:RNA-directed DNA polymerase, eukaryota, partial [Tanacetum coccineum]
DLNGCGEFCVKDVRNLLDAHFLPKEDHATRWVKLVPSKINVLAWKVSLDRLPTRLNLISRGVTVSSSSCPVCDSAPEDLSHLFSVALWLQTCIGLFVVGGILVVRLSALIQIGFPSSFLLGWGPKLNVYWKVFFMSRGGVFGISGINCCSRIRSLRKKRFLMILLLSLFFGVTLDVKVIFLG